MGAVADQGKEQQMQHRATRQDQIGLQLDMSGNTLPSGANLTSDVFRAGTKIQAAKPGLRDFNFHHKPRFTAAHAKPAQSRCPEQYTRAQR